MGHIYGRLALFHYTLGEAPIYGIWHPFVFNNTGKANHGGKPITG